jgi:hypothetical protein
MEQMKDVYIVQCLMETDLYKLLKTQVSIGIHSYILRLSVKCWIKKEEINDVDRLNRTLENRILVSRLLVTITYVIFCTKYCGDWSIYTRRTCYTETWSRAICCWIPPVTLRSATSVWRESQTRSTITQVSLRNM